MTASEIDIERLVTETRSMIAVTAREIAAGLLDLKDAKRRMQAQRRRIVEAIYGEDHEQNDRAADD